MAGLSYEDTKAVAKDAAMEVFKENATRLVREAHDITYGRAEEFAEIFLMNSSEITPTRCRKCVILGCKPTFSKRNRAMRPLGMRSLEISLWVTVRGGRVVCFDSPTSCPADTPAAQRFAQTLRRVTCQASSSSEPFWVKRSAACATRRDARAVGT